MLTATIDRGSAPTAMSTPLAAKTPPLLNSTVTESMFSRVDGEVEVEVAIQVGRHEKVRAGAIPEADGLREHATPVVGMNRDPLGYGARDRGVEVSVAVEVAERRWSWLPGPRRRSPGKRKRPARQAGIPARPGCSRERRSEEPWVSLALLLVLEVFWKPKKWRDVPQVSTLRARLCNRRSATKRGESGAKIPRESARGMRAFAVNALSATLNASARVSCRGRCRASSVSSRESRG